MSTTDSQTQKLKKLMLASTKPAYFVIDQNMSMVEWSENLRDYGYDNLNSGINASNCFDFMVGYNIGEILDLPIMTTPNGVHASVSILPEGDLTNVLVMDASYDFQTQFRLQQKANETELLSQKQQHLMKQLFDIQKELAQKNRLLEESSRLQTRFLSGVSHEFRTPLSSIIGYSDALSDLLVGDEQKKISIIQSSAKYLLLLVENLLDHGRLDAQALDIQPKPVLIADFFNTLTLMMEPVAQQKSISLTCQGDFVESLLYFDETRVRQCIINIVNNAIKFTDRGGVDIDYEWSDHELIVSVSDTGLGMSNVDQENLFVSFWQSKSHDRTGTGLGLTITKRILDCMGGDIVVSSKLGKGTTVKLKFPAPIVDNKTLATDHQPKSMLTSSKKNDQTAKILLVEDDMDIADLVTMYLKEYGFDIYHVSNGQLAVEWFADYNADLVLMDMNMPIMSGGDAIKQLRQQGVTIPIFIMSATDKDSITDDTLVQLADGHIQKPVDFDLLIELMVSTLKANEA